MKNMINDKGPGPDGFTSDFFLNDLGSFITRSINNTYELGHFTESIKLGIMTCLPKAEKPKQIFKNWRPVSLPNVLYKIAFL